MSTDRRHGQTKTDRPKTLSYDQFFFHFWVWRAKKNLIEIIRFSKICYYRNLVWLREKPCPNINKIYINTKQHVL